MTPPKLFIAGKALLLRDGKVLIIRESAAYDVGTQTGKYDVPGGRLEPGQGFEESLLREIREETCLAATIGRPVFVNEVRVSPRGEDWQIVRVFFECNAGPGDVTLSADHDAYLWIDPAEYKKCGIIESLHPVFEAYLAQRKGE